MSIAHNEHGINDDKSRCASLKTQHGPASGSIFRYPAMLSVGRVNPLQCTTSRNSRAPLKLLSNTVTFQRVRGPHNGLLECCPPEYVPLRVLRHRPASDATDCQVGRSLEPLGIGSQPFPAFSARLQCAASSSHCSIACCDSPAKRIVPRID